MSECLKAECVNHKACTMGEKDAEVKTVIYATREEELSFVLEECQEYQAAVAEKPFEFKMKELKKVTDKDKAA